MAELEPIECKVATWYYRRMGLMILLLAGCACWFLWDGAIRWPKENQKADIYDAFKEGREGRTWESVATEMGWQVEIPAGDEQLAAVKEGFDAGAAGEKWTAFSSERRIAEKPKRHLEAEVEGQFHWAYGSFGLAGLVLIVMLINLPKKLTADAEAFYTPSGKRVPFDKVFRLDKRKWDNKGLAYAHYKDESDAEKKAVIDDLKFKGAHRILDRLLERFDGELIERAPIDDDDEEDDDEEEDEGGEKGDESGAKSGSTGGGPGSGEG